MIALLAIPLAPLAAALLLTAAARWIPPRAAGWLAVGGTAVAALILPFLRDSDAALGGAWLEVGGLSLTLGLALDGLSWWVAMLVAWVSLLVNVYAVGYTRGEEGRVRFFAWMSFFAASMLTLVLADSLLLLFIAWEGVGLASFALIGHHLRDNASRRAAAKAFLMTRLGDSGFLLAWLLALTLVGTTDIQALLDASRTDGIAGGPLTLLALLFFLAAVGKSAQLPLTAWLPDAMVGPTPVSALIHSATMVAAGVYLVLRLFPLFEHAPHALDIVLWTGGVTALFAALVATAQHDLKRILAWSTVSQLGEMMLALGLAGPTAAAFHLTTHACFKSGLFLCAGAVDKAVGSRDLREVGGLWRLMPWTGAAFIVLALALAGFPPLAGYWSEEHILKDAVHRGPAWAGVLLVLIALAGVYIGRAAMAVFGPTRREGRPAPEKPERAGVLMLAPPLILAALSIALGLLLRKPIERVLGFDSASGSTSWLWKGGAIAASLLGLAFGAWRARAAGPAPALGAWPGGLSRSLQRSTHAVARAARGVGLALRPAESGFDRVASGLATGVRAIALSANVSETALDASSRASADATLAAAGLSERSEDAGFWKSNDALARALSLAGAALRPLQSGKVFVYAMSVFVFVLAASAAVIAVAIASMA